MRNRNNQISITAALQAGSSLGASALCLLATIAAAQAQTATGSSLSADGYGLRGTTAAVSSRQVEAAASLYGALPASRGNSGNTVGGSADISSSLTAAAVTDPPAPDPESELLTGSIGSESRLSQSDRDYADSLARQNLAVGTVDGLPLSPRNDPDAVPGFTFGSLTLRPTLDQRVVRESQRYGTTRTSRTYSETTLSGTLDSDWTRNQLAITGSGTWQRNLSGLGTESPSANLNAILRLDMLNDITATLGAGYSYSQESRTDPNAISGATTQSGIHETRASIGLQKSLGALRGVTTLEVTRTIFGDATLASGGSVAANDRDTLGGEFTARIGYAVSPALVPFLEASVAREKYDQRIDSTGAERSSTTVGARAGAEIDLGEKLSGEIALGYVLRSLDDANLSDVSGLTLDGELNWSPLRGSTVNVGLATTLESATTAGEAGAVVYEINTTLAQQLHSTLAARLGATLRYRDYAAGSGRSNQQSYGASAGLTWNINRYLDLEADASYERTDEPGRTDEETTRIGLGLRLRR